MTSIELPAASVVRERILAEVEDLRARFERLRTETSTETIEWMQTSFLLDRKRMILVPESWARVSGFVPGMIATEEIEENLDVFATRRNLVRSHELMNLLAAWLLGISAKGRRSRVASAFLNYVVVQPLMNEAFTSLFWLGFSHDCRLPPQPAESVAHVLGPMTFDMIRYPQSLSERDQVRREQVRFVLHHVDRSLDVASALADSEHDWATRCAELMRATQTRTDDRIFSQVRHTAMRHRAGHAL